MISAEEFLLQKYKPDTKPDEIILAGDTIVKYMIGYNNLTKIKCKNLDKCKLVLNIEGKCKDNCEFEF